MSETKPVPAHFHRDSVEFARAFTFFDAVYAFALTLLVVNIDPPEASAWRDPWTWLASGLGWQLLGFVISFVVIAVFWRTNHRLSSGFSGMSPGTMTANIVALAFVVFIPFSTQGVSDPDTGDQPFAIAVYSVNIAAAVFAQSAIFFIARRDGLIAKPLPRRADTIRFIDTAMTPLVFGLSIVVAYVWGADWARWTWALLLVVGPISGRLTDRAIQRIIAEDAADPHRAA